MHEIDPDNSTLVESARMAARHLPKQGIALHSFHFNHGDMLTPSGEINQAAFVQHSRRMEALLDIFAGKLARVIVYDAIAGVAPASVNDPLTLLTRRHAAALANKQHGFFSYGNIILPWRGRTRQYFYHHYPHLETARFDMTCAEELVLMANGNLQLEYWSGRDASGVISPNARVKFKNLIGTPSDDRFFPTLSLIANNPQMSTILSLFDAVELAAQAKTPRSFPRAEANMLYDAIAEIPVPFWIFYAGNNGLANTFEPIFAPYRREVSVLPWRLYDWPVAQTA
jgi:hypothetical protein